MPLPVVVAGEEGVDMRRMVLETPRPCSSGARADPQHHDPTCVPYAHAMSVVETLPFAPWVAPSLACGIRSLGANAEALEARYPGPSPHRCQQWTYRGAEPVRQTNQALRPRLKSLQHYKRVAP